MQKDQMEISLKSLPEGKTPSLMDPEKAAKLNRVFVSSNLGFRDGDIITIPAFAAKFDAIRHTADGDQPFEAIKVSVKRGNKVLDIEVSPYTFMKATVFPIESVDTIDRNGKSLVRLQDSVYRFKSTANREDFQILHDGVDAKGQPFSYMSNEKPITITLKGVKCHATRYGTYDEAYRTIEVFGVNEIACEL